MVKIIKDKTIISLCYISLWNCAIPSMTSVVVDHVLMKDTKYQIYFGPFLGIFPESFQFIYCTVINAFSLQIRVIICYLDCVCCVAHAFDLQLCKLVDAFSISLIF